MRALYSRHFRPLGVGCAARHQHFRKFSIRDNRGVERRNPPDVRLRDGHGVVLPVEDNCLRGALITLRVDDRIAGQTPFGNAGVVNLGLLTTELVKETLHHLGGFLNTFAAVGDAGLANPLLQPFHVFVEMVIDVRVDLLEFFALDLGKIDLWNRVTVGAVFMSENRSALCRHVIRGTGCKEQYGTGRTNKRQKRSHGFTSYVE